VRNIKWPTWSESGFLALEKNSEYASNRRSFFRRVAGLTALGALGAVALERLPVPVSAATLGDVAFSDGGSGVTFDHSNFFWDDTNKRLGIGTSTPSYPFDLERNVNEDLNLAIKNLYAGKAAYFYFRANSKYVGIQLLDLSGHSWFMGQSGWDNFWIMDAATGNANVVIERGAPTDSIHINPSGHVGIGTASPAQMLTVAGDVGQSVVAANGLVKAAALVNGSIPAIIRSFNNLPGGSGPSVSQPLGPGTYQVNFGVNLAQRFFLATLLSSNSTDPGGASDGQVLVSTRDGNANAVFVRTNDSTGTSTNRSFYLMII
jgi:hypothetical protein